MPSIYIIGALKNRQIMEFAERLRKQGYDVFDQWLTPGPDADSYLLEWAKKRNLSYKEALNSYAARHVFDFDKSHIDRCDMAILYMPAGKSAHIELGYVIGSGKKAYILFDKEPERFDVMYNFATDVFFNEQELFDELARNKAASEQHKPGAIPHWYHMRMR